MAELPETHAGDLSNRTLLISLSGTLVVGCGAILLLAMTGWANAGSPLLQSMAILGAILLLGATTTAVAKRVRGAAKSGFRNHIWCSCAGFILVCTHTAGALLSPPAILLVCLLGLAGIGVWARVPGAQQMAHTFGTKTAAFSRVSETTRQRLRDLLDRKRALLQRLDATADEALFSLTPRHWLLSPLMALGYSRLVRAERNLLGTDQSVAWRQAYWRRVHQLLVVLFLAGLLVHVVLVTFFAGYVADGQDIYWWHITAWSL